MINTEDLQEHLEKSEVVYTKQEGFFQLNRETIIYIAAGLAALFFCCCCLICYFVCRYRGLKSAIERADHHAELQMGDISIPKDPKQG